MKLHIPFKLRLIWMLEGAASILGFRSNYARIMRQYEEYKHEIYYK